MRLAILLSVLVGCSGEESPPETADAEPCVETTDCIILSAECSRCLRCPIPFGARWECLDTAKTDGSVDSTLSLPDLNLFDSSLPNDSPSPDNLSSTDLETQDLAGPVDLAAGDSSPNCDGGTLDAGCPCTECAPGTTRPGGCDPCSHQVCGNDCRWSACRLKDGNACEHGNGLNTRPCTCAKECPHHPNYEYCLVTCKWSAQCVCLCNKPGDCTFC